MHTEAALLEAAGKMVGQATIARYDTRIAALRIHSWRGDARYVLEHAQGDIGEFEKAKPWPDAAEARAAGGGRTTRR